MHFKLRFFQFCFFVGLIASAQLQAIAADQTLGIGALGRIEPKSRVIRVSHNAGVEGTNLEQLLFQEADQVNKDDDLAVLADHNKRKADIDVVKSRIKVLEAKIAVERVILNYNNKEFQRYQALAKTATASAATADQKQLAFLQSQATIAALQAEIANARAEQKVAEENLAKTVIKAPISGTIIKIHARPGERIGDSGLLEMANLTQLDVVAEVYESDMPKVKVGQKADINVPGVTQTFSAQVRELGFQVKKNDLNDTDPLADRDNRIIEVRLTLEDKAVEALQHQIYRQVHLRIMP
ncbi:MAG: efflux RND transporter periplasmic adaptor subunit [Methylococcaceae bacterium]|nr:efflux RND transporter periplasmic adaptor subunit [Methylococcaceae bacterium]